MIKTILRRFMSLVLVMVIMITFMPDTAPVAYAETTIEGLSDDGIKLTYTESDVEKSSWSASGMRIEGKVSDSGCDSAKTSTLTITNCKGSNATLSFSYSITSNAGSITVDNEVKTQDGTFSKTLDANDTIEIIIESKNKGVTSITLDEIQLVTDTVVTTTFIPSLEGGSYTVNGKKITEIYSAEQSSNEAYELVAEPENGFQFLGWYYGTGMLVSNSPNLSLKIDTTCTITAKFTSADAALFETGGQIFADLNEGIDYAVKNNKDKITLSKSGVVTGKYTIPVGITLLIPFDEAGTLYKKAPAYTTKAEAQSAFKTLIMKNGACINVDGTISVGGKHYTSSNSDVCKTTGMYGLIKMEEESSITLNSGANLYAWGYIIGDGIVTAKSGATVYEYFQISDWRGGKISKAMKDDPDCRVFPFPQYYIQNVEAKLIFEYGAKENTFITVTASRISSSATIQFIGKSGDAENGLFRIVEGGTFSKKYDPNTDRMLYETTGMVELENISLSAGVTVNSSDYVLPINNNTSVSIKNGRFKVKQDIAFLPSVEITIDKGAELSVSEGKKCFVYDRDEWGKYLCSNNVELIPIKYSPTKKITRIPSRLVDAKIDVNGQLIAEGEVYTTKGGANICSSEKTGKYVQSGAVGNEAVTYQSTSQYNSDPVFILNEIPVTPAKLYNGDNGKTGAEKKEC